MTALDTGRRITLPSGKTGTAYEGDGLGRRLVHLDDGRQVWLRETALTLDPGLTWTLSPTTRPCQRCPNPGRLYPSGRWCDLCRPYPPNPTPDPARTYAALLAQPRTGPAVPRQYGDGSCDHPDHPRPGFCRGCGSHRTPDPADTGRLLRDTGTALAAANAPEWRAHALDRIRQLAATGDPFTADDVTATTGMPPTPNAVGAAFLTASRQGLIVRTGDQAPGTGRAEQHARRLTVWTGA